MSITIQSSVKNADGQYLADAELQLFEDFLASYHLRHKVYMFLQERSQELILETLREMMHISRQAIQEHGEICRRDMSYVLRFASVAILRNDDAFFTEHLVLWMQNIMMALRKEQQSAQAYRILQTVISRHLPEEEAAVVNHYLSMFVDALMVGAQAS